VYVDLCVYVDLATTCPARGRGATRRVARGCACAEGTTTKAWPATARVVKKHSIAFVEQIRFPQPLFNLPAFERLPLEIRDR